MDTRIHRTTHPPENSRQEGHESPLLTIQRSPGASASPERHRQLRVGQNGAHIASRAVQVECARHVEREHHSRVGKNFTLVSEFGVFTQPYMDTARFAKLIVM